MKNLVVVLLLVGAAIVPGRAAVELPGRGATVPVSLVGVEFDKLPPVHLVGPGERVTAAPAIGAPRGVLAFPASALVDGTEVGGREHRCGSAGQVERVEILLGPTGQAMSTPADCRATPLNGSFRWDANGGVINLGTRDVSRGIGALAQPRAALGRSPFRQIHMRFSSGFGMMRTNFAEQACERFNGDLATASPRCAGDDTARSVQAGLDVTMEFAPRFGLVLGGVYRNSTGVSYEGIATSGNQQLTNRATGEIKKVWQAKIGAEWRPIDRLSVSGYWAPAHRWSVGTFADQLVRNSIPVAGGTTNSWREDSDHRMWGASANYRVTGPWGAQVDYFSGSHPSAFPATNNARAPQDVKGRSVVGSGSYTLVTYRRRGVETALDNLRKKEREEARRWVAGIFAGHSGNWGQSAGDVTPFARGTPFVTFSGLPAFFVPTWNFGHGAEILNLTAAELGVTDRIAPLDGLLTSGRTFSHDRGLFYDATVGAWMDAPLGVYARVVLAHNPLELPDDVREDFESSAATAERTWSGVLRGGSGTATSQVHYLDGSGRRVAATAGVQLRTGSIAAWQPVFRFGAGSVWSVGTQPRVDVVTDYRFTGGTGARFHETDRVAAWAVSSRAFALEGGAEVHRPLSDRLDFVAGVNLLVYRNTVGIQVSATPEREISAPPGATAFTSRPSIQFGNDPRVPPSSLSSELQDFRTFTGRGWRVSPQVKSGVEVRF